MLATLAGVAGHGGVVGIHAIDGMAGIGKTTLAVHAAHRLAAGFPDGQFFLPLHAHTPGQRPVEPADALASLLLTAGVPAQLISPGLEARAQFEAFLDEHRGGLNRCLDALTRSRRASRWCPPGPHCSACEACDLR